MQGKKGQGSIIHLKRNWKTIKELFQEQSSNEQPSVRKQHNAGYKHKANVRIYYQQYEAQQNQYLIDQKVKEHLGQAAAYQQVGAAYNQLRPRLPVLHNPMMPIPGNPMMPMPGMRPLAPLPRPIPGYPGMPPMVAPPGAPAIPGQVNPSMPGQVNPSMPGQVNPSVPGQVNNGAPRPITISAPTMAPGSSGTPTSGAPSPMFNPAMYQANPTAPTPASGGFESPNASAQPQEANH